MTDEQGIATVGGVKSACLTDSEDNILSVVQFEWEVQSSIDFDEIAKS